MLTENGYNGVFLGRSLFQAKGDTGGAKHVFVKWQGSKDDLVYPTFGGRVMNPFKGAAKLFAGDLMEIRYDENGLNPVIYLLKTYKVKSQSGTTVKLYRDRYTHIPFAGDILMKAPAAIGGTGTAGAVTAVTKGNDGGNDTWDLTVDSNLTGLTDGDILVEANQVGASASMIVKTINAVAACDYDFLYSPVADTSDDDEFGDARYFLTPAVAATMYKKQMSPYPECVEVFNISNFNGQFHLDGRINRVRE